MVLSNPFSSASFSGLRMVAATCHPFSWNSKAVARPIPVLAPVMSTVFCMVLSLVVGLK